MFCIPMGTMHFISLDEADMDQIPAVVGQQRTITNGYACVVLNLCGHSAQLKCLLVRS